MTMKRKLMFLLMAGTCILTTNAQLILNENFNSAASVLSATPAANNWIRVNNSSPVGSTSWFIGNVGIFPSFNGTDSAYFAANYNSTAGTGTINTWLITPTVSLANGGILKFATRTATSSTIVYPDRLEVYLSTSGTLTAVSNFSTLIVSVNPSLTTTGYPTSWTVYTATLSGITGTTSGRIGFRYSVPNAGPTGTNSSYIGLDAVNYSLPCANPTLSISSPTGGICSGSSINISASGATTYTWSSGQNSASITLSPSVSTIYTLNASSIPNCNSTETVAVSVTLTPNLAVSDVTTCLGTTATLVVSGASTYSWDTGATSTSILVTPTVNTTYSVTGFNGICQDTKTVSVAIGASLSINATSSQSTICSGSSLSLTASGASNYSWAPGASTLQGISVSPSVTTTYTLSGASGSCTGVSTLVVNVLPTPSVVLTSSSGAVVCVKSAISFTASGASTYSWSASALTSSIISVTTASVAGTYTFGVIGTATNGCVRTATISRVVDACVGLENVTNNASTISIYPNPFSNELKINGLDGKLEIYNAIGQLILKQSITATDVINTAEFAKGIYVLKVYNSENKLIQTSKTLKN
jgi:hypothetical protein